MDKQSRTEKSDEKLNKQSQTNNADEENNKHSKTEKGEEDNNLPIATGSSKTGKTDEDNNLPIASGSSKVNLEINSSRPSVVYSQFKDVNQIGIPSTDKVQKDTKADFVSSAAISYNADDIKKQPITEKSDEDNHLASAPAVQEVHENNIYYWDEVKKYKMADVESSDVIRYDADSQATLKAFVDVDETVAGPYRRKLIEVSSKESLDVSVRVYNQESDDSSSKDSLNVNFLSNSEIFDDSSNKGHPIVRLQEISEDYKLISGERHYYKDCSYHFPEGVGRHRQFTNVSRKNDDWYTVLSSIFLSLFILFFDVILYDHIVATFNMTIPRNLIEQPFLSFAPVGFEDHYRLVHYNPEDKIDVKDYSYRIVKFLQKLSKRQNHYKRFGPCQMNNKSFGYEINEPCIFMKINRLIGFQTDPFDDPLKVQRPLFHRYDYEQLKFLLSNVTTENDRKNRIWISCACKGKEKAKIDIFPEPFIKTKYVDRKKLSDIKVQNGKIKFQSTTDLNRVVALKISNLKLNVKYYIKCKSFARNIVRKKQGYGKLYFYIMIDRLKPHLEVSQEKT